MQIAITNLSKMVDVARKEFHVRTLLQLDVFIKVATNQSATLYDLAERDGQWSAMYHRSAYRLMGKIETDRGPDQILLEYDIRVGDVKRMDMRDLIHKPIRLTKAGKRAWAKLQDYIVVY